MMGSALSLDGDLKHHRLEHIWSMPERFRETLLGNRRLWNACQLFWRWCLRVGGNDFLGMMRVERFPTSPAEGEQNRSSQRPSQSS